MSDKEKTALYEFIGVKICGSISIIPCLLLIIVYSFKQKLTLSMYINLNLCITALLYSISGLFPSFSEKDSNTFICNFQVFLGTTGDISILLWTGTISVIGTISYKYQNYIEHHQFKMKLLVTCINYGIVVIFNIIFQGFGEVTIVKNTKYCWITNMSIKSSFSILILIIYIINIIANIILLLEVKEMKKNIKLKDSLKKLNKFSCLLWKYIFGLILIFLDNIIHFIEDLIKLLLSLDKSEGLSFIDVFLESLNFLKGLIVCFIYTYNEEFYDDLFKLFKCKFSKKKDNNDNTDKKEINVTKVPDELTASKNYYNAIDFFDVNDNDDINNSNIEFDLETKE